MHKYWKPLVLAALSAALLIGAVVLMPLYAEKPAMLCRGDLCVSVLDDVAPAADLSVMNESTFDVSQWFTNHTSSEVKFHPGDVIKVNGSIGQGRWLVEDGPTTMIESVYYDESRLNCHFEPTGAGGYDLQCIIP
jgi:hypothetical protein